MTVTSRLRFLVPCLFAAAGLLQAQMPGGLGGGRVLAAGGQQAPGQFGSQAPPAAGSDASVPSASSAQGVMQVSGQDQAAAAQAQMLQDLSKQIDQLRAVVPHATSLMMDGQTLVAHRDYWGVEDKPTRRDLHRLTDAELALYNDLRDNRLQPNLRLEQERVRFGWVQAAVQAACTS